MCPVASCTQFFAEKTHCRSTPEHDKVALSESTALEPNTKSMKNMKSIAIAIFSGAALVSAVSCDVKKTQDGNLPEVEVKGDVKLPKYDVDAPSVEIKTEKKEIEVPTIKVTPASEDTNDQ